MTDFSPEALALMAEGSAPPKKSGKGQTIVAIVGVTLIAAAGGAGLGFLLKKDPPAAAPPEPAHAEPAATELAVAPVGIKTVVQPIEPILTNLTSPVGTQVRLETAVILNMAAAEKAEPTVLASQIQADMLVFLRTLELAQIEGSRGLLHLKEDLLERAKLRSPAVQDIIVRSLIVK